MSVLVVFIMLLVIILIHELGHFLTAKLFKMNAYQFNIGMGPVIFKKTKGGTEYAIRLLPIGGSVMLGEDLEPTDDPGDFRNKPVWQRIIVISAGAILNLILGFILCVILYTANPIPSTTVSVFDEGATSNTGESALKVGDRIVKVNDMNVVWASEIFYKMDNSLTKNGSDDGFATYEFTVIRNGERIILPAVKFAATPNPDSDGGMLYNRDFYVEPVKKTPLSILEYSARGTVGTGRVIWLMLSDIVKGTYGLNEVSGVVGMVDAASEITAEAESFRDAALTIVGIAMQITINLGIVNLLPIPALDGARIVFLIVEAIRRKPIKPEIEGTIHFVGLSALMIFIAIITFSDISKIVGRFVS